MRGAAPRDVALRGVALGELELATMAAAPPIRVEGDVRRLEIAATPSGIVFRIEGDRTRGTFVRGDKGTWSRRRRARPRADKPVAVLTPAGAAPGEPATIRGACAVSARDVVAADATRTVVISARGRPSRTLGERFGAGLAGLPLSSRAPRP